MPDPAFKDHFSGHSAQYRKYRPAYPDSLFRYLASIAPGRETAWDCATGTGQSAKALSAYFAKVIATDASEKQIANAVADQRIDYRVEPSERTSMGDAVIDLITVAQALHWFDSGAFYGEAKRVLKDHGVIAVWSYNLLRMTPALDAVIDELYWDLLGGYWPPERRLIEDGYRGIEFPFKAISAPEQSMRANWSITRLIGYLGTWSAVQKYKQARGTDPVAMIRQPLAAAWGDSGRDTEVIWPLTLMVGEYVR